MRAGFVHGTDPTCSRSTASNSIPRALADGPVPRAPVALSAGARLRRAQRNATQRNATIACRTGPGPTGYNVRRDISPERLTLTCEVFADRFASPRANLALHALNVRQACFVAVEAFGETGVSTLSRIVRLPTSRRCPAHPDPASSIGRLPPLELRAGRLCPPGEIVGKTGKGTIDRGTPLADGHGLVAQSFGDVADGECA